jgi:hypothetical protein
MKAIVISNCNTTAYYNYLKSMFPDWDVRSVVHTRAVEWLNNESEPFLKFLSEVDVLLALPSIVERLDSSILNPHAITFNLPGFVYMGTRPDCFWLHGVKSPMQNGVIHSKIATGAFYLGKSVEDTVKLFTEKHYEKLGYFSQYKASSIKLIDSYKNFADIDISEALINWEAEGDFMHTPNHPHACVLFDVIHIGMRNRGILTTHDAGVAKNIRDSFDDYLAKGIGWPIYPEFVQRFEIKNPKTLWNTGSAKRPRVEFGLDEFVRRSFAIFEDDPNLRSLVANALGDEEKIANLGGH